MHPKSSRGRGVISIRLFDGTFDENPLRFTNAVMKCVDGLSGGGSLFQNRFRQVYWQNYFCRAEYNGPLNGISELAHIAGPIVTHEAGASWGRNACHAPLNLVGVVSREESRE